MLILLQSSPCPEHTHTITWLFDNYVSETNWKYFTKAPDTECPKKCLSPGFCGCQTYGGNGYGCVCKPGYRLQGNICEGMDEFVIAIKK